jgi:hypothetical protein
MKADVIYSNQSIRIKAKIRDVDGVLTDPSNITFELERPNDTEYTVYGTGTTPAVTKESTGIWYIDLEVDTPGKWKYSWFTLGTVTSSWKGFFQVEDARYL